MQNTHTDYTTVAQLTTGGNKPDGFPSSCILSPFVRCDTSQYYVAQICYERCNDGTNTHFGTQYGSEVLSSLGGTAEC